MITDKFDWDNWPNMNTSDKIWVILDKQYKGISDKRKLYLHDETLRILQFMKICDLNKYDYHDSKVLSLLNYKWKMVKQGRTTLREALPLIYDPL